MEGQPWRTYRPILLKAGQKATRWSWLLACRETCVWFVADGRNTLENGFHVLICPICDSKRNMPHQVGNQTRNQCDNLSPTLTNREIVLAKWRHYMAMQHLWKGSWTSCHCPQWGGAFVEDQKDVVLPPLLLLGLLDHLGNNHLGLRTSLRSKWIQLLRNSIL